VILLKIASVRVSCIQNTQIRGETIAKVFRKVDTFWTYQELMDVASYDVDDAHDDELVTVYEKENLVIAVGKLFPNMGEFRMCFKTYALKKEFDAKTMWTDRKKFYARC
jgi:hypothetical protein